MKQVINFTADTPSNVKYFIKEWKRIQNYPQTDYLTIGECLEILIGTTYNLRKEDSSGQFFNHLLTNAESIVGWDGQELIDILFYEVIGAIKKRINTSSFSRS